MAYAGRQGQSPQELATWSQDAFADAVQTAKQHGRLACITIIPGYDTQGVGLLSPEFNLDRFRERIRGRRHQVRVFLMDQSALSAIGNAYADEILFAAGIHPKTRCDQLQLEQVDRLYKSAVSVLCWGIQMVEEADRGIGAKVRDHLKVRNRRGKPCPACGTTIRRTGVLGYDSFFCPKCQPEIKTCMVPWDNVS